jgi:hypothetical protein
LIVEWVRQAAERRENGNTMINGNNLSIAQLRRQILNTGFKLPTNIKWTRAHLLAIWTANKDTNVEQGQALVDQDKELDLEYPHMVTAEGEQEIDVSGVQRDITVTVTQDVTFSRTLEKDVEFLKHSVERLTHAIATRGINAQLNFERRAYQLAGNLGDPLSAGNLPSL